MTHNDESNELLSENRAAPLVKKKAASQAREVLDCPLFCSLRCYHLVNEDAAASYIPMLLSGSLAPRSRRSQVEPASGARLEQCRRHLPREESPDLFVHGHRPQKDLGCDQS